MVEETRVEVDMVPYIDIVSLLLLFLVITGDMAKSATGVKMLLPKADQAKSERTIGISTEGRIVVQMKPKDPNNMQGAYQAVVETTPFDLTAGAGNASLNNYLKELVERRLKIDSKTVNEKGEVKFPVKLRIPKDAPMYQVQRVALICAKAGLVDVHYAANNKEDSKEAKN